MGLSPGKEPLVAAWLVLDVAVDVWVPCSQVAQDWAVNVGNLLNPVSYKKLT